MTEISTFPYISGFSVKSRKRAGRFGDPWEGRKYPEKTPKRSKFTEKCSKTGLPLNLALSWSKNPKFDENSTFRGGTPGKP